METRTVKKARRHSSPLVKELLNEITPTKMRQTKEKMQLAARIEDLMNSRGFKKGEFAKKLGKNPSEITKWFSGTHNFTMDTLVEIAEVLGNRISDFFGKRETPIVYSIQINVASETHQPAIPLLTPSDIYSNRYARTIKKTSLEYAGQLFTPLFDTYPNG